MTGKDEQIIELFELGYSVRWLSHKFGVRVTTIRLLLYRHYNKWF